MKEGCGVLPAIPNAGKLAGGICSPKKIFMTFRKILAATALFLCISSCSAKGLPVKNLKITRSDGKEIFVKTEIAEKTEERNKGFMFRKNIPDGTGMLFIFEKDQILHFWMKNTPHPLSIAYIDYNGKIRDIFDMTPLSEASISSTVSVRYALEVPQGWFEKEGISKGDMLALDFYR